MPIKSSYFMKKSGLTLRSKQRKENHVADRGRMGEQQDQPVDADPFAGGRRHAVFEGAHVIFVNGVGGLVARFARGHLLEESLALVRRFVQLGERMGGPPPADIKLEAINHRRILI